MDDKAAFLIGLIIKVVPGFPAALSPFLEAIVRVLLAVVPHVINGTSKDEIERLAAEEIKKADYFDLEVDRSELLEEAKRDNQS